MRKLSLFLMLSCLFVLTGCFEYDDVEFKGVSNFKMGAIKEGKVTFDLDATIFNPNKYTIKVKPSTVDLYVEGNYIGVARLQKTVTMKKKQTAAYPVPMEVTLEKGALFKLMRYATQKQIEIQVKGKVKGSVYGLSKKFDVDEKKTISTKDFKL